MDETKTVDFFRLLFIESDKRLLAKENLECLFGGRKARNQFIIAAFWCAYMRSLYREATWNSAEGIQAEPKKQWPFLWANILKKPLEIKGILDNVYYWSRPLQKK